MKLTTAQKLERYRRNLARYVAEGDPMAKTQARLIAALEVDRALEIRAETAAAEKRKARRR